MLSRASLQELSDDKAFANLTERKKSMMTEETCDRLPNPVEVREKVYNDRRNLRQAAKFIIL